MSKKRNNSWRCMTSASLTTPGRGCSHMCWYARSMRAFSEIQHNGSDRSHHPTHGYVSWSSAIPALRTSAFLRCFKLGGCLMNMCCKRSFDCIENGTTVVLLFQRLGMAARVGSSVVGLMAALAPPAKARGTRSMWVALAAPIALGLATSMVQRAGPIVHTRPLLVRMF